MLATPKTAFPPIATTADLLPAINSFSRELLAAETESTSKPDPKLNSSRVEGSGTAELLAPTELEGLAEADRCKSFQRGWTQTQQAGLP